jgi:hypothetical protein
MILVFVRGVDNQLILKNAPCKGVLECLVLSS